MTMTLFIWMTWICLNGVESFQKHLCFFKVVPDIAANDFGYLAFAAHMHSTKVNYRRFQKMSELNQVVWTVSQIWEKSLWFPSLLILPAPYLSDHLDAQAWYRFRTAVRSTGFQVNNFRVFFSRWNCGNCRFRAKNSEMAGCLSGARLGQITFNQKWRRSE